MRRLFTRLHADERGIALIMALGMTVVLSISSATALYYTTTNLNATDSSKAGGSAYHLAEAGLNDALATLYGQLNASGAQWYAGEMDPQTGQVHNVAGVSPLTATLLPATTVQAPAEGGSFTYSGTIDSNYIWHITSTGTVAVGRSLRTRTLTQTVNVQGINDGADGGSWSRFYQDSNASCLTIDNEVFVTNVGTRGNLCIRNNGGITGASVNVNVGGTVSIIGPDTASGPRSPSAGAGWTNPANVYTSNSVYATNAVPNNADGANQDTTGFGFAIPTNAIIHGITVSVVRKAGVASTLRDVRVNLLKAGAVTGSNKASTGSYWGTSNGTVGYGSSTDLWGATWTPADVNAANFGVRFAAHSYQGSGTAVTASLDYISVTVNYTADTNGIGTSSTSVAQANIGGTCTYNAQTGHSPCTSTDHVYAGTVTVTPPAQNDTLSMPQVDFNYWWANAKPGPKHFCTNANPGLATNFFDNDAGSTSAPNKSILVNGEMAPSTNDYDCQVVENGVLVGQLKWTRATHRLDIKGTIFVDGNFRFDTDGEIIHYFGRATLMSSRDDEIDALVCAGGTGNTYSTSCLTNMSSWDMTQNMMVLMSQMDNEYDQGGTTCAGNTPPTCYNGHLPGGFQGIMYSTADCLIHQNFQDSGPVICNTITLPDEGGLGWNPSFFTFPYIGNLTDGQKYANTATATNWELTAGQQAG